VETVENFVKFGDGMKLQATGIGQVITPIGQLEAIYVPQLCANLLSVSQLNKAGASVSFLPEKSEIMFSGRRFPVNLVGNIFQIDEMYCFHSNIPEELHIWHQKLGHLNFPAVISYLKRFGIQLDKRVSNLFCRTCAQAKLSERRFHSRDSVMKTILGRVHSDIGGPIPRSHEGYCLWVTFLDESSRYAEIRCMKSKAEASSIAQDVLRMLQAKKNCGMSFFRTDGGAEYQSIELQQYLKESGIEHEVTPPYTP
jgi:hypothetical protein